MGGCCPQIAEEVRAAVASIEFDKETGQVIRIKLCDKVAALDKAMKHAGLYERDSMRQRGACIGNVSNVSNRLAPRLQ
jgi:hypothetical protein